MSADGNILTELARGAYESRADLFTVIPPECFYGIAGLFTAEKERTLLLLPGAFAVRDGYADVSQRFGGLYAAAEKGEVLAADIRLAGNDEFRAYIREQGFRHILVPFAELASPYEYGYRSSYAWIGEMRAEMPPGCRITALFSFPQEDYTSFCKSFGCAECTVADLSAKADIQVFAASDIRDKLREIVSFTEKHIGRTAVIFTDRREAEEALRYFRKRGIRTLCIHGACSTSELSESLARFSGGGYLLIATKSVIPSVLFFRADRVIYAGVPYSRAFAARCAAFSSSGEINCIFSPADIETDRKIIAHFADRMDSIDAERFLQKASDELLKIKKILYDDTD